MNRSRDVLLKMKDVQTTEKELKDLLIEDNFDVISRVIDALSASS